MRKVAFNLWIIASIIIMLTLVSCTIEEVDDINDVSFQFEHPTNNAELASMAATMEGYYFGTWWINDEKVEAESFDYQWYEKNSFTSNNYVDKPKTFNSFLQFLPDHLLVAEFPYRYLTKFLFPDRDIKYLTTGLVFGITDNELQLLYSLIIKKNEDLWTSGLSITPVGYSNNVIYYEVKPIDDNAYRRFCYVVTFQDDDYLGIVLEVLPSKSTVTLDLKSQTMSLSLLVSNIEIYDKEGISVNKHLNTNIKIKFISSIKSNEPIYKSGD